MTPTPPDPFYEDMIIPELAEHTDPRHPRTHEAALLGAILRRPVLFESLRDELAETDFDWHCYRWAWVAFGKLFEQGLRIDTITLGDELERAEQINEFQLDDDRMFTGRAALSRLRERGEPASAASYAEQILDYSAKRQLLEVYNKAAVWALNGRRSNDIVKDVDKQTSTIRTPGGHAARHTMTMAEAATQAYNATDAANQGAISFVQTELIDLDTILDGGMSAPDLLIVAGRPGQGKTGLLITIAKNAAQLHKKHVAFFSLEMANIQVARRMIAQESGIPYSTQKTGKLAEEDWAKFIHGFEVVSHLPITINDMEAITVNGMRSELRKMEQVDLVVVDYIQLAGTDDKKKNEKRYQEVGEIARGCKSIAKEFDVPVLAAAQMSRAVEQRANKRPVLSDLRESGDLEQSADVVIFLYDCENEKKQNIKELIVAKHRNGRVGSIETIYRDSLTKFENAVTKHVSFNEWEKRKDIE